MTLGQFADNIIEELGYNTVASLRPDRRNIIMRADAIREELLSAAAYQGTMIGGEWRLKIDSDISELADQLYISKTAPVAFDTIRNKYYSNMPGEYISFNNLNGIRMIRGIQDNTVGLPNDALPYFIPQKAGSGVAYGLLESAALTGQVGYEIEGQQLFYNNMLPNSYTNVLITFLPKLSVFEETDVLPMSGELLNRLIDKTKDAFMLQRSIPRDKVEGQ